MANLFKPPPKVALPLVKGQDLVVDFKNRVPGSNPATYDPYPVGAVVTLVIDHTSPVTATATIDAEHATCRIESTVTDDIAAGVLWRCRVTLPGPPATDLVAMNGKTVRADGA